MKRYFAVAGLMAALLPGWGEPAKLVVPPGSVCWPLHISGITLGVTTDQEVERLLGHGISHNEGDTGGRYFTNNKGTATLHVVWFTDQVVGEVTLTAGIAKAIERDQRPLAVSDWFDPEEGFGNWHALRLGSSKEDVLNNLREPKKKVTIDEWRYDTTCACELPEYFTIFFKEGRVVKVVFSAPPG